MWDICKEKRMVEHLGRDVREILKKVVGHSLDLLKKGVWDKVRYFGLVWDSRIGLDRTKLSE